jgi:phosphohistidine phosphatase
MIVFIMRHGEANTDSARADGERHLTDTGTVDANNVLNTAKQMGIKINAIASSPLARAKETAEIAARIFGKEYTVANSLEPEGSPEGVYDDLTKLDPSKSILLISHQPLVSTLLADILGGEPKASFATGTLAMVKVDGHPKSGSGALVFLMPPSSLLRM